MSKHFQQIRRDVGWQRLSGAPVQNTQALLSVCLGICQGILLQRPTHNVNKRLRKPVRSTRYKQVQPCLATLLNGSATRYESSVYRCKDVSRYQEAAAKQDDREHVFGCKGSNVVLRQ